MRVNYVLMYGTPYLRYKEFETFEDISKFIVLRNIVDYTIFEKMEDKKEVEMIYRDNDIKVLEERIEELELKQEISNEDINFWYEKYKIVIERIDKTLNYIEKEWHWDGTGIDDLEKILKGED